MVEQNPVLEKNGAPRYVEYLLKSMSGYTKIDPVLEKRSIEIMHSISDENTVYPSAGTESDGSVTLHWHGGSRVVELNVGLGGDYFYCVHGRYPATRVVQGSGDLPLDGLRSEVKDFSAYVSQQNPAWRSFFPEKTDNNLSTTLP